jgi:polyphosphate kinase
MKNDQYFNRELSWLSFNYRVLQEAKDKSVPLLERLKFLAIYSSNLDEFYRVRVASLRALLNLKEKSQEKLNFNPSDLIKEINKTVTKQQEEFGTIFNDQIIPQFRDNGINLVDVNNLESHQIDFIEDYYEEFISQHIQPILIVKKKIIPFLRNRRLYLTVRLKNKQENDSEKVRTRHQYAILEIPTNHLPRFVKIPSVDETQNVIFLDDIIRHHLELIFEAYEVVDVYSIKLTRDAELYIDDEFSGNLLLKIQKGLTKRNTGVPARFLFDEKMPREFLKFLKDSLLLTKDDLVKGGRYHNFNDFFSFPIEDGGSLSYSKIGQISHKTLSVDNNIYDVISKKDHLTHFPYHSYDYVINFLEKAAEDPNVTTIKLTQYRVAESSRVVSALSKAARNGKDVMVFVELKARFDEEHNIKTAEEMENAGIRVYYSFPGLKVHAKLALVERREIGETKKYCYLATGNFNEKTSKIYTDMGLFTTDQNITKEVDSLFKVLTREITDYEFKHILVAQFNLRKTLSKLVDYEISNAQSGNKAKVILKMNSLEDKKMISKLYEASQAGVKIELIIRGVCCLVPGVKGLSENISVISIVDRFLEHTRVFLFHNGGKELIYGSSADWMKRNLSGRIEVAFPILDKSIKLEIKNLLKIQLADNTHSRIIDKSQKNKYQNKGKTKVRSQYAVCDFLK